MAETKGRGRPRNTSTKEDCQDSPLRQGHSGFTDLLCRYMKDTNLTRRELMAAIGVSESQFSRWESGAATPRKANVNRIAIKLAERLDQLHCKLPANPSPASDAIDGLLNQLLDAAGFSGSVKGRSGDDCWNQIDNKKFWTLGYTTVPGYSIENKYGGSPTGKAIEYAEKVRILLGLEKTEWVYLKFDEMPAALRQGRVHGIAPFMIVLPGRLFDYSFSRRCGKDKFTLSAITDSQLINNTNTLEELSIDLVELLYLKDELGDWGRKILSQYESRVFPGLYEATSYIEGIVQRKEEKIPILLIDNITGNHLIEQEKDLNLSTIQIKSIEKLTTYNAFAFHPGEKRLIEAVDAAIKMIPSISISTFSEVNR